MMTVQPDAPSLHAALAAEADAIAPVEPKLPSPNRTLRTWYLPPGPAESNRNRKRAQALRDLGALEKEDEKRK